ncbi:fimbria/pilus outer membrane usher protein [Vibrio sp. SS-MA-C1-2]|uniref:fimbria/pilus outer membrane usher protein n=1 Tax=Vibrio sp. SS-MA-C1-2 TaxID=2908646 RepID=UPI001F39B0A0|nr:fimbria/pilus outer membrane usher protein [Vibrio sp. SS-MA-C1-2]UJF18683.1 fimbria/pilus outer membrane usher protein [Vibrio sp. SS-MA-C1-2]
MRFSIFIVTLFAISPVFGADFNTAFIQGEQNLSSNVDQLLEEYHQLPLGKQHLNVFFNHKALGYLSVMIVTDSTGEHIPCFSLKQKEFLGINLNYRAENKLLNSTCNEFFKQLNGKVKYDPANLALSVSIPNKYLKNDQQIDFEQRQFSSGINSAFINYSLSARYSEQVSNDLVLPFYSDLGINLSDWRIRANFSDTDLLQSDFEFQQAYAAKPIIDVAGEVVIGESLTQGEMIDSIPYLGFSFRSDSEILPRYKQYYSPLIHGVADSNSTVNIYQGHYLIYTKQVAAGAFIIDDLPRLSNNQIWLEVISADGTKKGYPYTVSDTASLLSDDTWQYEVTGGLYRQDQSHFDHPFFYTELGYGIDRYTVRGGMTLSDIYAGFAVGVAVDMGEWGALGIDYQQANSQDFNDQSYHGDRISASYSQQFDSGFHLQLSSYINLSPQYFTFSQGINRAEQDDDFSEPSLNKSRFEINANYDFYGVNFYLNLAQDNYRSGHYLSNNLGNNLSNSSSYSDSRNNDYLNQERHQLTYSAGFSGYIGGINYSVSGNYTDYSASKDDHSVLLTLNFPLSFGSGTHNAYSTYTHNQNGDTLEVGQNGSFENYTYSLGTTMAEGQPDYLRATLSADQQRANYSLHADLNSQGKSTVSGNLTGAVALFNDGVVFGSERSDNYIIAKVGDQPDVIVNGHKTNAEGYVLLSHIQPYEQNQITVDSSTLTNNLEIGQMVATRLPIRGAMNLVDFDAHYVSRAVLRLIDQSDHPLPLGTVINVEGKTFAVGLNGEVMVTVLDTQMINREIRFDTEQCRGSFSIDPQSNINQSQQIRYLNSVRCL